MSKIAFVFPGQGAQYIGMGKQLVDEYEVAKHVLEEASESLGFDIKKMIFEGDEETLKITENTQPAILTISTACMKVLNQKGINPDVVAGLSLGEYTAHVASGSMNFFDTVSLVKKRGKYMQEAVPLGVGTMAAIMGLDEEILINCCEKASEYGIVEPANFNCPGQIVVAGEVEAVSKLVEIAKENGAKRAMLLPVSAPFHCSMLKPAGDNLHKELQHINLNKMNLPVLTNVTGEYITNIEDVKDLLVKQVSSSVLWDKCIRTMIDTGVDTFIEVGPGKVLSGFIKKINKEVKILNVEDIDTLEKTTQQLG